MLTEHISPRFVDLDSWSTSDMIETMYDGQFGACAAVGPATNAAVKALLKHEGKTVSATISELEAQPARSPSPPTDAQ